MDFKDFVCGLMAGWSQVIFGQPFDFIKVKIQTSNNGLVSITNQIFKQLGLFGFYRGSSSMFFGFGGIIGLEFFSYQFFKRLFFKNLVQKSEDESYEASKLRIWQVGLSGSLCGVVSSSIYCPVEYVKIRKQLNFEISESSFTLLMKEIYQNKFKNIMKGYSATVSREFVGGFFYFGIYESIVRYFSKKNRDNTNSLEFMLAGAVAGVSYHLVTYPIDTIKTNIQAGSSINEAFRASLDFKKLKGYNIVLIRAALVNSVSFMVYEKTQSLFKTFENGFYTLY